MRQVRGAGARRRRARRRSIAIISKAQNKTRLVVNLSRKAIGRVGLAVQLQKDLHQPELLTPTGKAANIAAGRSRWSRPGTVERATGRLVIYAPESLRVNPGKTAGLRSISFKEAFEGMQSAARRRSRPSCGPCWPSPTPRSRSS